MLWRECILFGSLITIWYVGLHLHAFRGSPVIPEGLVGDPHWRYKSDSNPTEAAICKYGSVKTVRGNSDSILLSITWSLASDDCISICRTPMGFLDLRDTKGVTGPSSTTVLNYFPICSTLTAGRFLQLLTKFLQATNSLPLFSHYTFLKI